MVRIIVLAATCVILAHCKTSSLNSGTRSVPQIGGKDVTQGGEVLANHCQPDGEGQKGHEGNKQYPEGIDGWRFNEAEGCFLQCRNEAAVKADFLRQLHSHRIYGNPANLENDPIGQKTQQQLLQALRAKNQGVAPHSFANLTTEQIFDGSKWQQMQDKPRVGDLFLNMNFGQPNHAGIFYSKRGIAHARLVVEVTDDTITLLDSGWENLTKAEQINSQTIWLRPKAQYFDEEDRARVPRWARNLAPVGYDNTLYDDWAVFRHTLESLLQNGVPENEAAAQTFRLSQEKNFAPGGLEASFSFKPKSGLYCSEGPAAIFMYSGFRLFGENALDILKLYGAADQLPPWEIYADALSGFGADSEKSTYMMHKLFFTYFQTFDSARRAKLIKLPGYTEEQLASMSTLDALQANFRALSPQGTGLRKPQTNQPEESTETEEPIAAERPVIQMSPSEIIADQFTSMRRPYQGRSTQQAQAMLQSLDALEEGLAHVAAGMSQTMGQTLTAADALYLTFYANKSYGPQTFFENSKYFDLKGVFYNTDLNGGYQALYISDWWLNNFEQGYKQANLSTTLYNITEDESLPADRCVIGEAAPYMANTY